MRLRQFAIATLVGLGPAGVVAEPVPPAGARHVAKKSVGSGVASHANLYTSKPTILMRKVW